MNKKWSFTLLSGDQKARLCILAKEAFAVAQKRGAVEDGVTADEWRKAGQMEACGEESLRNVFQPQFLAIRGKWFAVLGNLEQAFYDFVNAGEANEARRLMAWRMMGQIAHLSEPIAFKHANLAKVTPGMELLSQPEAAARAWSYAGQIAKDRFKGRRIESLDFQELEQLGWTITNRANDMQGKGKPENRNKSQHAGRKRVTQPENGALEPFERGSSRDKEPHEIELTQPVGVREPLPF